MWRAVAPPLGLDPFGLIVVDGSGWCDVSGSTPSPAGIAGLRRHGLVLAFLSIGTVHEARPYAQDIPPEWRRGPVPRRPGEHYMDVRSGWVSVVLAEGVRLVDVGVDGLLVAGLDVVPALADGVRPTIRLVNALRAVSGEVVFVVLNGLDIAGELSLDAIACESVFLRGDGRGRRMPAAERAARVARLRWFRDRDLPVFTLDYAPPGSKAAAEAVALACAEGFRPAVSVPALDRPPHAFAPVAREA